MVAQLVKDPPAMWETGVLSLGWKWKPTPVLLPGKSHGQRSLVGSSPWGRKELDKTERLHFHFHAAQHSRKIKIKSKLLKILKRAGRIRIERRKNLGFLSQKNRYSDFRFNVNTLSF